MKKPLLPLAILCLTGLVGCSTVPTIGQEEPKEVDLYVLADSLEKPPPDPAEIDDLPEEVKAVLYALASCFSGR